MNYVVKHYNSEKLGSCRKAIFMSKEFLTLNANADYM